MISTPSSSASSSSHGEALKKAAGRRAMTLMSLPPRRRDDRQQSMAVLPTPMISTRSPIESDMSESDRFQPVDSDVDAIRIVPARDIEILCREARPGLRRSHRIPDPTAPFMLSIGRVVRISTPISTMIVDFLVQHLSPAAGRTGCWCASARPACLLFKDRDFIAKRHQVIRDGE